MKPLVAAIILLAVALLPLHSEYHVQQGDGQTLSVNVELIDVLFTVFDRRGRFITNLNQDRFKVFEDNRAQTITNFSRETNLPLTIALLIDTSGSIRDRLRFEQEAAIEFFYATLRRGADRGLLVSFDSGVDLLQDYTDDPELLANSVRRIRAGGGTSMYDALYLAAAQKLAGQQGRRVLILISDGDDNSSRISLTETLEEVQRHNVVIYAISTNASSGASSRDQERGDRILKRFAEETGGKVFFPRRLEELAEDFKNISGELRAQYTLAYRSANVKRDGAFRKIRIDVADRNYQVRARTGYYASRAEALQK